MYTILIVDDEELVRNAITKIIDWGDLGFSELYQAENGQEALEVVRNHKVDLVLTDIVMPYMDGLQLSEILSREFPNVHVVILTGHEDFEYAKQSMDYGVKNYILKPVGASTLYTKMSEICKKLHMETTQKQYIKQIKSQLYQVMPTLREKLLFSLVCSQHGQPKNIMERSKGIGMSFESEYYAIGIISPDLSQTAEEDIELFAFAAKNITFDCVGNRHYIFDDNNHNVVFIFQCDEDGEETHDIIYRTLQVIQKAVMSTLKVDATCALGSIVDDVTKLCNSYVEATTALECKFSLGANGVYDINDLDYIEKSFYYPFDGIKNLLYNIKFLQEADIRDAMNEIYTMTLRDKNLSSSNIKIIFIEIITSLLKEVSMVKEVSAEVWNEGFRLYQELETMGSIESIVRKFIDFSIHVSKELKQLQFNSGQSIIETVKEYVEQNFMKSEISLTTAAEYASVSTGYLSVLFKKEAGINFVKYLTDVRMEKSMELLKHTDKKTYEIAEEVGFADSHYFSISFKKYTGMAPSAFRLLQESERS